MYDANAVGLALPDLAAGLIDPLPPQTVTADTAALSGGALSLTAGLASSGGGAPLISSVQGSPGPQPILTGATTAAGAPQRRRNLFVAGLPSAADDAALRRAFEPFGVVTSAKVMRDMDTGRSRGFGFVLFETDAAAAVAIEKLQGCVLPHPGNGQWGDSPSMQLSHSKHSGEALEASVDTIFVRNVPLAAGPDVIQGLFRQYGTVIHLNIRPQAPSGHTPANSSSGANLGGLGALGGAGGATDQQEDDKLCIVIIRYSSPDMAKAAVKALHLTQPFGAAHAGPPLMAKLEVPKAMRGGSKCHVDPGRCGSSRGAAGLGGSAGSQGLGSQGVASLGTAAMSGAKPGDSSRSGYAALHGGSGPGLTIPPAPTFAQTSAGGQQTAPGNPLVQGLMAAAAAAAVGQQQAGYPPLTALLPARQAAGAPLTAHVAVGVGSPAPSGAESHAFHSVVLPDAAGRSHKYRLLPTGPVAPGDATGGAGPGVLVVRPLDPTNPASNLAVVASSPINVGASTAPPAGVAQVGDPAGGPAAILVPIGGGLHPSQAASPAALQAQAAAATAAATATVAQGGNGAPGSDVAAAQAALAAAQATILAGNTSGVVLPPGGSLLTPGMFAGGTPFVLPAP